MCRFITRESKTNDKKSQREGNYSILRFEHNTESGLTLLKDRPWQVKTLYCKSRATTKN